MSVSINPGAFHSYGPGIPVAFDPLWLSVASTTFPNSLVEAPRFAALTNYICPDGSGGGSVASAWGLQRVSFNPTVFTVNPVSSIFVSPEDIVFQSQVNTNNVQSQTLSTIVPDLSPSVNPQNTQFLSPTIDWRYTWMFTGRQTDVNNGTIFDGDIVVFENRPLALDQVAIAGGGTAYQAVGETVVEAVFGFGGNFDQFGYARGVDKTVLLRWPATVADPDVRVGGWIADVTYERSASVAAARFGGYDLQGNPLPGVPGLYPGQRCNWYQVVKKSAPASEGTSVGLNNPSYRAMTVWINTKLKAKTQFKAALTPSSVNVALVCPYVVNAFPRTVYMR